MASLELAQNDLRECNLKTNEASKYWSGSEYLEYNNYRKQAGVNLSAFTLPLP